MMTITVNSEKERRRGDKEFWNCHGSTVGVVTEDGSSLDIKFAFDHVFPPDFTNEAVYKTIASDIVRSSIDGINGTIFAYGVTSSGKTHTMMGNNDLLGIVPRAILELFQVCDELSRKKEIIISLQMLEIYNEIVNDLLDLENKNLKLREDPYHGVMVEGIKEERLRSSQHALDVIKLGNEHRKTSATALNEGSSRSHTMIRISIKATDRPEFLHNPNDIVSQTLSYLTLVDLAGSESAKAEINKNQRMEGSFINKSLLTLGTVIHKLSEGNAVHIPYRDSKLTRILSNSLTGNGARVAVICTITPASTQAEETHNTLKFAGRAKQISIEAKRNEILDQSSVIVRLQQENALLRRQLELREDSAQLSSEQVSTSKDTGSQAFHTDAFVQSEIQALREKYQEEHMAVVRSEQEKEQLKNDIMCLKECVADANAASAILQKILHDAEHDSGVDKISEQEKELELLRRQVENLIQVLLASDFEVMHDREDTVTLDFVAAEREYMANQLQIAEETNVGFAKGLERARQWIATLKGVDLEAIPIETLIDDSVPIDGVSLDDPRFRNNVENKISLVRHGDNSEMTDRILKLEQSVQSAFSMLQRSREERSRQNEVYKELKQLIKRLEEELGDSKTKMLDLLGENENLKRELERVEAKNKLFLGYGSLDDLSQAELYRLINELINAVNHVRLSVQLKKVQFQNSQQPTVHSGMTADEISRAVKELKSHRNLLSP